MKTFLRTLVAAPVLALCLLTPSSHVFGSSEEAVLDAAPINLKDQASLQRGAKTFVNYCMNCHNASFMRYSHLTQIGLTEEQIKANLMFGTDKIGDTMISVLDAKDAKEWFGAVPPDLSLVARARASSAGTGSDWLYTYLRAYYRDSTRATGWNNALFENVGMPHILCAR